MKKNLYIGINFFILMFLFSFSGFSIKVETVEVQTLSPPERLIKIPSDTTNIAIVAVLHNNIANDSLRMIDSVAIASMAMAVKTNLEDSPQYDSYIFPVFTINEERQPGSKLTTEQLQDIKESSGANYLISIEQFNNRYTSNLVHGASLGAIVDYLKIQIHYNAWIRIYETTTMNVIDERNYIDSLTLMVEVAPVRSAVAIPTTKIIQLVCQEVGKFYSNEIASYWKSEERMFYTNARMNKATDYAYDMQWSKAMEIWGSYVNSTNVKTAAAANFNMALGCEMLGEYDLALEWLNNAKRLNSSFYSETYENIIKKRISDKEHIDKLL